MQDSRISLKLVVLDGERKVLIDTEGDVHSLPNITIPANKRIAYAATLAVREKYDLDVFTIVTAYPKQRNGSSEGPSQMTLVCRLQRVDVSLREGLRWAAREGVELPLDDCIALDEALTEFTGFDSGAKPSNFGRFSSLDDLRSWYNPTLESLGVREKTIEQWNGDPWFALFRIDLEPIREVPDELPKALWFKAVGDPNTREFAVTKALTEECPYWFPKVVGWMPERNGWLMEEVNGHELDVEKDGRPWALTARILAKVQKRFVGRENELLTLGCKDWRMPIILDALDPFFDDMGEIMRRQIKDTPRPLDASELCELKTLCKDLCRQVEDLDIPYTIAHGDFSPHNVLVSNGWPILTDWAEAYVTFPFISWEYFWNRMIKDHPDQVAWHERMHRNYAYRVWASMLGTAKVDEGLRFSPALAVLIHALYGIDAPQNRRNPKADPAKRSLVRRLQRELKTLEPVGML